MQGSHSGPAADLSARGLRVGIVRARFNEAITGSLSAACRKALLDLGIAPDAIDEVLVPGALEVPLALQAQAHSGRYDALVALGCIIRGETYHFELVANESGAGVTRVGLDHRIPIANAILTVENLEQAQARQVDKGREAAWAAVEMVQVVRSIASGGQTA